LNTVAMTSAGVACLMVDGNIERERPKLVKVKALSDLLLKIQLRALLALRILVARGPGGGGAP